MAEKVELGAPSPAMGKGCKLLVADAFGQLAYPLRLKVVNHMPCGLHYPKLGLFLYDIGQGAEVEFSDREQLMRLAGTVEQMAVMSGHPLAVTLEAVPSVADATPAPTKPKSTTVKPS